MRGSEGGNVCQLDDEVQCTHNSQCTGTQLCARDGRCRDVCITDKDCVTDLLCVTRVCAKPEETIGGALPGRTVVDSGAACVYATDCPADLVCLYGRCDVECLGDKDCLVGWTCRSAASGGDGRCYPAGRADGGEADTGAGGDASSGDAGDASEVSDGAVDASDASDAPPPALTPSLLAIGFTHSCTALSNGLVKCWGSGGQLGLGDVLSRGGAPGQMGDALPYVALGTGRTVKALSAGNAFTCAILDDNKLKCWGVNSFGQLGLGDANTRGANAGDMGDALPYVNLGAGRTALSVTMGFRHTCALVDNGKIKCWGDNVDAQLGLGDKNVRGAAPGDMGDALPYVDVGAGRTVKAVSAGALHTCAILDNDKLKCWGRNSKGQLGLGDAVERGGSPAQMGDALPYVDLGAGRTVKTVFASAEHTCAILDNDKLKCWGDAFYGTLGLGDQQGRGDQPGEMGDALPYVDLGTGRTPKSGTGSYDTCAILDNGKVKCWGRNSVGQLGLGDTTNRGGAPGEMGDALAYVDLGAARTAKAIGTGFNHTCAILDNGTIKCWGDGASGVLGLGNVLPRGDGPGEMGDALPYVVLTGVGP